MEKNLQGRMISWGSGTKGKKKRKDFITNQNIVQVFSSAETLAYENLEY